MRRFLLALVALVLVLSPLAWGGQTRAILLVWDARNDRSLEVHLRMVQLLKSLRASGDMARVSDLDSKFKVYDLSQKAHAKSVDLLGIKDPAPYVAVVTLDDRGIPASVVWGMSVTNPNVALAALKSELGLTTLAKASPTPTPAPTVVVTPVPLPSPSAEPSATGTALGWERGLILVGDPDNQATADLYNRSRQTVSRRYTELNKVSELMPRPFGMSFNNPSQRAVLEQLGVRRQQCPMLAVARMEKQLPVQVLWSTPITNPDRDFDLVCAYFGVRPAQAHTSTGPPPPVLVNEADGQTLVLIPAGTATIGSDEEAGERPPHTVKLDAFYLGKTEVTNAQFAQFVAATGYQTDAEQEGQAYIFKSGQLVAVAGACWQNPSGPGSQAQPNLPVVCVTVQDALRYARWAGGRLPTELEWERAARGNDGRTYPWGNSWNESLCRNSVGKGTGGIGGPCAVGSFPGGASPFGCLDMAGNVYEWTASAYNPYPGNGQPDANMNTGRLVVRGGSWGNDHAKAFRCAKRVYVWSTEASVGLGFRIARDP